MRLVLSLTSSRNVEEVTLFFKKRLYDKACYVILSTET
jgi:hypothetical protein